MANLYNPKGNPPKGGFGSNDSDGSSGSPQSVSEQYGVYKPGGTYGTNWKIDGGSFMDQLVNDKYISDGQKWKYEMLIGRENAEYNHRWDMYMQQYLADLGLETAGRSREQIYNQLIAMGMSPSAAMQAAAGIDSAGGLGSGSGSGGAIPLPTPTGNNPAEIANAAVSAFGTLSQTTQGIAGLSQQARQIQIQRDEYYDGLAQAKQLHLVDARQNQERIEIEGDLKDIQKDRLDFDVRAYENMYKFQNKVIDAQASPFMDQFRELIIEAYRDGSLTSEDLSSFTDIYDALKNAPKGSMGEAALNAYHVGLSEFGYAWDTGAEEIIGTFTRSFSQKVNNDLAIANEKYFTATSQMHESLKDLYDINADILNQTSDKYIEFNNKTWQEGIYRAEQYCMTYESIWKNPNLPQSQKQAMLKALQKEYIQEINKSGWLAQYEAYKAQLGTQFLKDHPGFFKFGVGLETIGVKNAVPAVAGGAAAGTGAAAIKTVGPKIAAML